MFRKTFFIFLALCFLVSCSGARQVSKGPVKPKPFVTPWEYYQKSRSAVWTPEDGAEVQKTEVHTLGEDTKSDKTHYIIIGVVVGVVVIGGTVAGILLAK